MRTVRNDLNHQHPTTFSYSPAAGRADDHASAVTEHASLTDDYKQRAREQWSANPCGAQVARDFEFETREYFDAIEHHRYVEYAPWMKQVIGFDRYKGKRLLEAGFGTGTDLLQFA